jgi:hypothetical protein
VSINVPLANPKFNEGVLVPALSGTPVGKDVVGVDQGILRFKVGRWRIASRNKIVETTGDGSSVATIDANQIPVTVVQLSGFMLSSTTVGLRSLAGLDRSTGTKLNNGTWAVRLNLNDTLFFNGYCVIADVTVEGSQDAGVISVSCTLYITDTTESQLEATLTTHAS